MKEQNPTTQTPKGRRYSTPVNSSILLDMADTTWRMFVPTIGLLMIGRRLDISLQTKPWYMLAGTAVGGVIAWLLIKKQVTMKRNI